jgi:hypothetical protein
MNKKHYVYIHYKADDDQPFYVGKGVGRRSTSKLSRSKYWNNIVNKHSYYAEITDYFHTNQEALNREKSLIASMRYSGITLCNLTDGGEGSTGYRHTEEARNKIGKAAIGNKNTLGRKLSEEHKKAIVEASIGNKYCSGKKLTEEHKLKLKLATTGAASSGYKGDIIGTNIATGETVRLQVNLDIESKGFDHRKVYACAVGKRKTHKGYTFSRL